MSDKSEMVNVPRELLERLAYGDWECASLKDRDKLRSLLAAPAEDIRAVVDEPVAEFQFRTRFADRDGDEGWSPWERSNEFSYADYVRVPLLHGWEYQTRKLYLHAQRETVMPERFDIPKRDEYESADHFAASVHEANTWNACLDEFARLNK